MRRCILLVGRSGKISLTTEESVVVSNVQTGLPVLTNSVHHVADALSVDGAQFVVESFLLIIVSA